MEIFYNRMNKNTFYSLSETSKQINSNQTSMRICYIQLKLAALKEVAFAGKLVAANVKTFMVSNTLYVL